MFSRFAAWFPGGATVFRPSCGWPSPLSEPCLRNSRTRLLTWPFAQVANRLTVLPSRLCDAVLFPPFPRDWARAVCPHIARPCVASFPPAALPAFIGNMKRSDSLRATDSASLISVVGAHSHPWKNPQGLPGCRAFTVSCMPWSQTPGKRARPGRPSVALMLTSANETTSPFPL